MDEKRTHVLRIHLGLFFAEAICISALVVELSRALSGNSLSWAYVVEWPVLGSYAIYMWRKLLNDEKPRDDAPELQASEDDPRLAEWNAYLAHVHSRDQSDQEKS